MQQYILSIDQGTTSTRAILFDLQGHIEGVSQQELMLHYPHNGWVEQNAEDIWRDTQAVCRDVLEQSDVKASQVLAIGITNQRETTVVWDCATGKPLYNAIVWQDRRTADLCQKLKNHEAMVQQKTGLLLDPYFSGTKIKWILDNVPGARAKANKGELAFGTIDSFLLWKLTGGKVHATDITNASRTLIFNIVKQQWDDELLAMLDIPRVMLPEVRDNSCLFGTATKDFLGVEIPITGMAGDQQAALFGQACFDRGMTKATFGTGSFVLMNAGSTCPAPVDGLLTTLAWDLGTDGDIAIGSDGGPKDGRSSVAYAVEGSVFVAGAGVQWLRDGLGIIDESAQLEPLARSVDSSEGVVIVPAFTGLGSPHWDPAARGTITGLTRGIGRAHLARAMIEAMGFQVRDVLEAMGATGTAPSVVRVDGGAAVMDLLLQHLADQARLDVLRPQSIETTALGAATMAGLAEGVWGSLDDLTALWTEEASFAPVADEAVVAAAHQSWMRSVGRSAGWAKGDSA